MGKGELLGSDSQVGVRREASPASLTLMDVWPVSVLTWVVLALGTTETLHHGAAWNKTLSGLIGILVATLVAVFVERRALRDRVADRKAADG